MATEEAQRITQAELMALRDLVREMREALSGLQLYCKCQTEKECAKTDLRVKTIGLLITKSEELVP